MSPFSAAAARCLPAASRCLRGGALSALEIAASIVGDGGRVTRKIAAEALPRRYARYDKSGEEHYNLISALHKAVRGSDPDAALYWSMQR